MTQTAHRGSGRRKMSVAQNLNNQQRKLGLDDLDGQCLPSLDRNTGIEPDFNLHSAVVTQIKEIYRRKFISEEMALEARAIADSIEKYGRQMLHKEFYKTTRAIAILSFQKTGYKAFGLYFKSELNNNE
ncbi:MAG: hypothetical protein ACO3YX_06880 [Candidatus Nanopelagicaceae bacterium]